MLLEHLCKLHQKFLEKEGALTLDDLLRIARSQEAGDRQLKQYGTDQVNNQLSSQLTATCSPMIGQFVDTMILASTGIEWL